MPRTAVDVPEMNSAHLGHLTSDQQEETLSPVSPLLGSQMDRVSVEQRSRNMARIRSGNTRPEMVVRKLLHGMGYRYRLHVSLLPGTPDLVFPSRRCILLVHGCYWHRHRGCRFAFTPKSHTDFWMQKFEKNVDRDSRVIEQLRENGWRVLVVWGCETRKIEVLSANLVAFLGARTQG
jgi:DNA mismatch endonuclease, patch repair protein